jgi:hypothetical protein
MLHAATARAGGGKVAGAQSDPIRLNFVPKLAGLGCGNVRVHTSSASPPVSFPKERFLGFGDIEPAPRYAITPALKRQVVMSELGPRRA